MEWPRLLQELLPCPGAPPQSGRKVHRALLERGSPGCGGGSSGSTAKAIISAGGETADLESDPPLCFSAGACHRAPRSRVWAGLRNTDVTLTSPLLLGVCDGAAVWEEDPCADPTALPRELLAACRTRATTQLTPGAPVQLSGSYAGPISLLWEAYGATRSRGSTDVLLAALDNSTVVHGRREPMVAVLSIGGCALLLLRREATSQGRKAEPRATAAQPSRQGDPGDFGVVFDSHMAAARDDQPRPPGSGSAEQEKQRLRRTGVGSPDQAVPAAASAGSRGRTTAATTLTSSDSASEERLARSVIEDASLVQCVSVRRGDIVVLGSDGLFGALGPQEVATICNSALQPRLPATSVLSDLAQRLVQEAHARAPDEGPLGEQGGAGGGVGDDTAVVVAEIVEFREARPAHRGVAPRAANSFPAHCLAAAAALQCPIGVASLGSCPGLRCEEASQECLEDLPVIADPEEVALPTLPTAPGRLKARRMDSRRINFASSLPCPRSLAEPTVSEVHCSPPRSVRQRAGTWAASAVVPTPSRTNAVAV
mmetsp:Transcript_52604/g.118894  ORF Transcript_52604/g.118894 Transcript_52604/m.118894 type:complete len:541 (+) Transcript_52604:34-1656(+)